MKDMARFGLRCVGVITHGHSNPDNEHDDGTQRYLFFHDKFLGNHEGAREGAAANQSLIVLMAVLEDLKAKELLPTSRTGGVYKLTTTFKTK